MFFLLSLTFFGVLFIINLPNLNYSFKIQQHFFEYGTNLYDNLIRFSEAFFAILSHDVNRMIYINLHIPRKIIMK